MTLQERRARLHRVDYRRRAGDTVAGWRRERNHSHDWRPATAPWSPTCHRRQGARVSLSAVVLAGWRLWMESQARGSGSRPWPSVLPPAFAASAWLPGLLGARAHTARVPAACGDGSELDRGPRRPRSASQGELLQHMRGPCHGRIISSAKHPPARPVLLPWAGLDGCQEAVWASVLRAGWWQPPRRVDREVGHRPGGRQQDQTDDGRSTNLAAGRGWSWVEREPCGLST
jgi:hypothetical protein